MPLFRIALALCAAALYKGIAVGAFRYCGVLFVGSHTDAVQAAVIFRQHIVLALCDGTADIGVFLFDFHGCLLRFHGTSDFICADLPCFLQNICPLHAAASVETTVLTGQLYFAEKRYSYSMAAGQADYTCHFLKQNKKAFAAGFPVCESFFAVQLILLCLCCGLFLMLLFPFPAGENCAGQCQACGEQEHPDPVICLWCRRYPNGAAASSGTGAGTAAGRRARACCCRCSGTAGGGCTRAVCGFCCCLTGRSGF